MVDGHRKGDERTAPGRRCTADPPPPAAPPGESLLTMQASTAARVVDARPWAMLSTGAGDPEGGRGRDSDRRSCQLVGKRLELVEVLFGWWLALTPDFAEHVPCCPVRLDWHLHGAQDCCCP